jgi:hypothetical protein
MRANRQSGRDAYLGAGEAIARLVSTEPRMRDLREFLLSTFADARGVFLVGGVLRDQFLSSPRQPKDVDVVVAGVGRGRIRGLEGSELNFFGGATLPFQGLAVDIWPLEDTYHIREFGLPKTIGGYLRGAPFNLDKIAYGLHSRTLHDDGCLAGIASRRIVYAPAKAYLEEVQALRCVLLRWKTSFALDDSAIELLNRVAERLRDDRAAIRTMKTYLSHLKRVYDESTFDRVLEEIALQAQEANA